ncbi:Nif3-like dinuclear metal center hexameric protein, partial [Micromonospora sp. URMC 105]
MVAVLERRYPPSWAEEWDRVGLVLGEPTAAVRRVACV